MVSMYFYAAMISCMLVSCEFTTAVSACFRVSLFVIGEKRDVHTVR